VLHVERLFRFVRTRSRKSRTRCCGGRATSRPRISPRFRSTSMGLWTRSQPTDLPVEEMTRAQPVDLAAGASQPALQSARRSLRPPRPSRSMMSARRSIRCCGRRATCRGPRSR
jgi:hypothetical protein